MGASASATAFLATSTALQAVSSVGQGYAEQSEAEYNAGLINEKVGTIAVQQELSNEQYERMKGRTWGTSMANVAKMGIRPTGSALAVMLSAQKEIATDQLIDRFNLEQEKRYTQAEAEAELRRGGRAVGKGYSNALSTVLKGGYDMSRRTYSSSGSYKTKSFGRVNPNTGISSKYGFLPF